MVWAMSPLTAPVSGPDVATVHAQHYGGSQREPKDPPGPRQETHHTGHQEATVEGGSVQLHACVHNNLFSSGDPARPAGGLAQPFVEAPIASASFWRGVWSSP